MSRKLSGPPTGKHIDFAFRFRAACERVEHKIGATQEEQAKSFGVGSTTIHAWRHGLKNPSTKTSKRMAEVLGVSYDWLMTGRTGPPDPSETAQTLAQKIDQLDPKSRAILEAMLNAATPDRSKH